MGILSDFFIAAGSEIPDYQGGTGVPAEDRRQFRRLTPLEAGGMLAALRGDGDRHGCSDEFKLLTPQDAEEWTMVVPRDMVDLLAGLQPEQYAETAAKFADVTFEELDWSQQDFESVVSELSTLAKRALESGKSMYLWNSI